MRCFRRMLAVLTGGAAFGIAASAMAYAPVLLAVADEGPAEPYVVWVIKCLGGVGLLILLSSAALFIGACLVVALARRPAVIASYLVFLVFPPLLGVWGAINGIIQAFAVIARADVVLKQTEIIRVVVEALVIPSTALALTIPSYLVIACGLFLRTILAGRRTAVA
jgi:hypothetical protein